MKILSCGAGMQSTALALMACENAREIPLRTNLRSCLLLRSWKGTTVGNETGCFHRKSVPGSRNKI